MTTTTPTFWGDEFPVNSTTNSSQELPQVTGLASGGFVVVWQDFSATGGDVRIGVTGSNPNFSAGQAGSEAIPLPKPGIKHLACQ